MDKQTIIKVEEFAKIIISLAADEKLTVCELCSAADTVKEIACCSTVDKNSIGKADYLSQNVADFDGKELFVD